MDTIILVSYSGLASLDPAEIRAVVGMGMHTMYQAERKNERKPKKKCMIGERDEGGSYLARSGLFTPATTTSLAPPRAPSRDKAAIIFGGNRTDIFGRETRETIEREGGKCDIVATDAASSASVKSLLDACLAKYGRIDILVANVGHSQPGCPATMEEEVWDAQMDINLKSVYVACHHVLPIMERQPGGGAIVCISSIAGLRYIGKPQVAYSTAKAAIMQFVKTTAVIYAQRGSGYAIRDNDHNGEGGGAREADQGADQGYEEFKRMREAQVPMGRMGDAWDVANAVLFLASDEARYVTGQKIVVDGGITSSTGRT
ncbi:hypothetical protein NUW58_g6392 [Xylaria curta]|uniref:Uncharacterized protein n=1 Tax=Xylaria curta TaxID=42375 RepID=A0ACC1NUG3_9PEZI|nr:hypothetical protein NUW58_g6392 [Xylaria curta]